MTDKDTREDILLLAELAEATGGVALETVGQAENLKLLTPEQMRASREKIAAKYLETSFEIDSVTAIHEMERLGPQKPDDFSVLTSHSFRMAGEQDQGGNSRRTTSRDAGRSRECSRNRTSWPGLADQALKQGGDPDEARRARGEADFLTSRAQKLAPDNDEVKKLRDEVVKLLGLKTN